MSLSDSPRADKAMNQGRDVWMAAWGMILAGLAALLGAPWWSIVGVGVVLIVRTVIDLVVAIWRDNQERAVQ